MTNVTKGLSSFLKQTTKGLFKATVITGKFTLAETKKFIERREHRQALESAMEMCEPERTTLIKETIRNWRDDGGDENLADNIIIAADSLSGAQRNAQLLLLRPYFERKKWYRRVRRIDSLLR
jgi:hypothetical protein